jgi:hypothetical protein
MMNKISHWRRRCNIIIRRMSTRFREILAACHRGEKVEEKDFTQVFLSIIDGEHER